MPNQDFPRTEIRAGIKTTVQHLLDAYPGEVETLFEILAEEAFSRAESNMDCPATFAKWARMNAGAKLALLMLSSSGKTDLIQLLYGE